MKLLFKQIIQKILLLIKKFANFEEVEKLPVEWFVLKEKEFFWGCCP